MSRSITAANVAGLSDPCVSRTGSSSWESASSSMRSCFGSRSSSRKLGRCGRRSPCSLAPARAPRTRTEGDRLYELLRRALVIAVSDPPADRVEAANALLSDLLTLGITFEQAPEGRLVAGERPEDLRAPRRQSQGDVAAIGVRDDVRGREVERLQERGQVVPVLIDAARRISSLAARVAAAVIDEDTERLCQAGHHEAPARCIHPRSVDQHEGLPAAMDLVIEPDPVRLSLRHAHSFLAGTVLSIATLGALGRPGIG